MKKFIISAILLWALPALLFVFEANIMLVYVSIAFVIGADFWSILYLVAYMPSGKEKTITLTALETYLSIGLARKSINVLEELLAFIIHIQRPNKQARTPTFTSNVDVLKIGLRPESK